VQPDTDADSEFDIAYWMPIADVDDDCLLDAYI